MVTVSSDNSQSRPRRQAILILGMHRSGASALAGVVRSLGVAAPKTFTMPDSGNPSGYWESVPLANAHDELLASAGSRWNDWRQLNPEWIHSDAAQRLKERIREILLDEYGDAPLSFIKDPRICRFVPFMSAILSEMNIGAVTFMMLRNPLEIAHSLRRREGITLPTGMMLWLRYVLDAEYHSRHMPRYFVTYEDLLMDWRRHLDRAAEKVGIAWPALANSLAAKIERFPSLDLHHEERDFKTLEEHPDVSSLVSAAYHILRIMSADGESQELIDQIDLVRAKFEEGCKLFGPMAAAEELTIEQLRGEIGRRTAESERLRASLEQQRIHWTQRDAIARQMRDALPQKDADNQRLVADLSASEKHSKVLRDAIARYESELQQRMDDLRRSELQKDELQAILTGFQLEIRALRDCLDNIYKSRSWRVTEPLRAISLLFRGNGASTRGE
jgi:hypothetical protein